MKTAGKITNTLLVPFICLVAYAMSASAEAQETPKGKVAELGLHRLERLVILKRIESSFQTRSITLSIESLVAPDPVVDPSFKVEISQGKAVDGTKKTLNLLADQAGKVLSFTVAGTLDPVKPPLFTEMDAVGLLEVGLHCVQGEGIADSDLCSTISEMPQFNEHFSVATLSEEKDSAGKVVGAKIEVFASGVKAKATILITLDGKLNGPNPVQIIPIP